MVTTRSTWLILTYYIINIATLVLGLVSRPEEPELLWRAYCVGEVYSPAVFAVSMITMLIPPVSMSLAAESSYLTGLCLSLASHKLTALYTVFLYLLVLSWLEAVETELCAGLLLLAELRIRHREHSTVSTYVKTKLRELTLVFFILLLIEAVAVYL
jgi:hypothetical protein